MQHRRLEPANLHWSGGLSGNPTNNCLSGSQPSYHTGALPVQGSGLVRRLGAGQTALSGPHLCTALESSPDCITSMEQLGLNLIHVIKYSLEMHLARKGLTLKLNMNSVFGGGEMSAIIFN